MRVLKISPAKHTFPKCKSHHSVGNPANVGSAYNNKP